MKSFTAADLQRLARGQRVPGEVFRAVFADPNAVEELARLLQVRQLLDTRQDEVRELASVTDMDVTFDDLAVYGEGRPLAPERRAAVERFLGKHFPEALVPPGSADTRRDLADPDTKHLHTPARGDEPPRRERGKEPNC